MSSEIPNLSKLDVQKRNYSQESGSDYTQDDSSTGKQSQSIIIAVAQEDYQSSQIVDDSPNIPWSFLRWDYT